MTETILVGDCLIGLEYILTLYGMQHIELADKLGIKKQNINLWIKGRQNIPKKYLPILEQMFHVNEQYFAKQLSEIEKLEIQKEKLKRELQPVIEKHEQQFSIGEKNEFVQVPVYNKEEINAIERSIEKARLVARFQELLNETPYIETYKLIIELLEKAEHEAMFHKTIEALAHYLDVLPDFASSSEEQDEFENELFDVFDDHNY